MNAEELVFISYAREDRSWAERLYAELRTREINAWLDVRCLSVGADWQFEIKRAIRRCKYVLLLLSRNSVNKRGFIQKEIKEALDVLQEFPKGAIFLIPARLDNTEPIDDELRQLNWVDLHTNFADGLARILSAVSPLQPTPLVVSGSEAHLSNVKIGVVDKGRMIVADVAMVLGPRAAISYAPFRTAREFLLQFFDHLPTSTLYADLSFSYYVTFDTRHPKVILTDDLKQRYPEYMTLVLQLAFRELEVREEGFSVILRFNGTEQTVGVPYGSVRSINLPETGLSIQLENVNSV